MISIVPECRYAWELFVLNAILKKWLPVILRKGVKSLNFIELRISNIDFYFGLLNIRLICVNFKKLREKFELTKSKLTKVIKFLPYFPGSDAIWRNKTEWSSIAYGQESKQSPNLPIWWKYLELRGIMINKGRIHRELAKFLMISSNLIISDDESMIDIGKMIDYERELQYDSIESKIIKFDFDFVEKLKIKVGGIFRKLKSRF